MSYLVKLSRASSPSGVAYIGPRKGSGFATEHETEAYRFDDEYEAREFADHFRGWWHGFANFDPAQIAVIPAAAAGEPQ